MKWETVDFENIFCFCNGKATKYLDSGEYPVYGSNGVLGYSHAYLYAKAIIVGRVGAYCGTIFYCPNSFWATDNTIVLQIKDGFKSDIRFCKYMLEQMRLNLYASGSAQPLLTQTILSGLKCIQPPIETQKRIADILSAYDDLIENNQKHIKLLEDAEQRLYKEWFIDLHFPGHETTPIINGIPEGWERKTVEKCLVMTIGGGWGKDEPMGNYLHKGRVIRGTDIPDVYYGNYRDVPLRYHTEKDIQTRSLQENDIIFELSNGNIDNIGRCLLIDKEMLRACGENAISASFCKLLRPINEAYALLLFLEIQAMQNNGTMLPLKKHAANGINNFDFQGFLQHDILVPNDIKLLDPIKTVTIKISNLREQLRLLTEARDRLLPKLMNGEIEV